MQPLARVRFPEGSVGMHLSICVEIGWTGRPSVAMSAGGQGFESRHRLRCMLQGGSRAQRQHDQLRRR